MDRRSFCDMVPFSKRADTPTNTLHASLAKSKSRTSMAGTGTKAKASLSSLMMALPTLDMTGFSSSLSIGMAVLCTQVLVHRWRNRTNDDWGTSESARVKVVGSSSKMEAISLAWGTGTKWYTGPLLESRNLLRIPSTAVSSSTSAARYWPVAKCLKRKREFQWPAPPRHGSCWTTSTYIPHIMIWKIDK